MYTVKPKKELNNFVKAPFNIFITALLRQTNYCSVYVYYRNKTEMIAIYDFLMDLHRKTNEKYFHMKTSMLSTSSIPSQPGYFIIRNMICLGQPYSIERYSCDTSYINDTIFDDNKSVKATLEDDDDDTITRYLDIDAAKCFDFIEIEED